MTPLCKSTLRRPRVSRPLASRFEEEAVRDDVRVVIRTSVLHQVEVQSRCLVHMLVAYTIYHIQGCTKHGGRPV